MFPIRDNIPSSRTPVVNYVIIAISTFVFFLQLAQGDGGATLIEQFGMIPARVENPEALVKIPDRSLVQTPTGLQVQETLRPAAPPVIPPVLTILTCIFLHGGWMHFLGNMWFLWIFGDNVEDRFGHVGYLVFYLATGVAASLSHLVTNWASPIPTIGASGAIAGVMGAYLLLYPHARVLTVIPIFFLLHTVVIPAPIFLGIWFLIQFFQGAFAISSVATTGVAWWAHIGGFAAGFLVVYVLRAMHVLRPPRRPRPGYDRLSWRR